MCQENYYFHSCEHLTYQGIHYCNRYNNFKELCVTLTTTPRITSLATPLDFKPPKRVLLKDRNTTSSFPTSYSNPGHVLINLHPRSLYPDLPDDFEIPPLPSSKAEYDMPKMTKRTVAVKYDCRDCRLERARPGSRGLTVEEEMVVLPLEEQAVRHLLWKSWHDGFGVYWKDPNTVREREERENTSSFVENLLWEGAGEAALPRKVELRGTNTAENGGADADQNKGKAVIKDNGGTSKGQAYVSIFGGD
ncbi:hypothetical protein MMC11_005945 [Xylographa trunciseda]|nr:hypothetical protein [Xylographa trunciseda]